MNPRASVTQANWIWPAAGALNVHFGGGREGREDKRGKPALCLLLVPWSLGREGDLQAEEELGQVYCFARRSICCLVAETLYSKAKTHEPSWSCLSFCLRPLDLHVPACVRVASFFHAVFLSNNPLQGYRDIICQASQQSSFLLWDYIREHRLYYHFRTY